MANEYDLISGYLGARKQKSEDQQVADVAQYRKEAIRIQDADAAAKVPVSAAAIRSSDAAAVASAAAAAHSKVLTEAQQLKNTRAARFQQFMAKEIPHIFGDNADPDKLKNIPKNIVNQVTEAANKFQYQESNESSPLGFTYTEPVKGAYADGGVIGFANGTPGGILITEPSARAEAIPTQKAGVDQTDAVSQPSAMSILSEQEPEKADAIKRNIYGATPKQFQKMMGAFALMDFADEKITSKGLFDQAQNIRKMQSENLGAAVQFALAGNMKKALNVFAETGDDRGENIASLQKYQISNPVPGLDPKKTQFNDKYDGLEITYKDGSKINLDPRKLLAETAGLQHVIDNDLKSNREMQQTFASSETTKLGYANNAQHAKANQNNIDDRVARTASDLEQRLRHDASQNGLSDLTSMRRTYGDPTSPSFITDQNLRNSTLNTIEDQVSIVNSATLYNIGNGGKASYLQVKNDFKAEPVGAPYNDSNGVSVVKMPSGNLIPTELYSRHVLAGVALKDLQTKASGVKP